MGPARTSGWYRTDCAELPRIIAAMLLAIDIGNTNVTIGTFRSGVLAGTRRAATDPGATPDEL